MSPLRLAFRASAKIPPRRYEGPFYTMKFRPRFKRRWKPRFSRPKDKCYLRLISDIRTHLLK